MVERGDEPSFPFKALVERLTDDFDGDLATQPVIFSFVDLPHAACGDEAENAEAAAKNLAFGERARGAYGDNDVSDLMYDQWWNSGDWADHAFATRYPINAYRKLSGLLDLNDPTNPYGGWWWVPIQSASSFHPGGANFAFADGSARFIKESIATWQNDPNPNNIGDPIGVSYGPFGEYQFGKSRPQVYQFLSTRNVGEIVSSDTF